MAVSSNMDSSALFDRKLDTLSVFSAINRDAVFHAFRQCFYELDEHCERIADIANFAGALYNLGNTDNWTEYLSKRVMSLEPPCSRFAAAGEAIPSYIEEAARNDLRILSEAAAVTSERMLEDTPNDLYIPKWRTSPVDFETAYFCWLSEIDKHGYGDYALYKMFHMELSDDAENGFILKPVAYPDAVQLSDLIGYELQRNKVLANTQALLRDQKASNVLLYGDAGTGKSATVKAIANAYAKEGLRLIELSKKELHLLPKLLELLCTNPLKFILFIDDLSFQDNDDDFSALKAVLEGSISASSHNT
ncbi:MAG: ATP-binding protein, partial [Oscillospiraceae bacterium]|nr:ATP-binding protein [Oscillospiraceae bacterium]